MKLKGSEMQVRVRVTLRLRLRLRARAKAKAKAGLRVRALISPWQIALKLDEARASRDALAKASYAHVSNPYPALVLNILPGSSLKHCPNPNPHPNLAQAIYGKLFGWVVQQVDSCRILFLGLALALTVTLTQVQTLNLTLTLMLAPSLTLTLILTPTLALSRCTPRWDSSSSSSASTS